MDDEGTGNISYIKESETVSPKPLKKVDIPIKKVDISSFDFNIDCDKYEKTEVKRKVLGYVYK